MTILNLLLGRVLDGLLYPFRGMHPLAGLAVVSLVTAVLMLLAFKATSNQARLAEVKRRIFAGLFEIRLFNDDLRAIFRALFEILRHNLTYLRLSLVPLAVMIVPFVIAVAHLHAFYGYRGLAVGEEALLTARFAKSGPAGAGVRVTRPDARLEVPEGLASRGTPIWIPSLQEMTWRLTASHAGDYRARLMLDGRSYEKRIRVSDRIVPRSALRPARGTFCQLAAPEAPIRRGEGFWKSAGLWCQLLNPAEAPIATGGAIASIHVTYPAASVNVLGFETHWIVVYIVLAMAFAFALRNRFGVVL